MLSFRLGQRNLAGEFARPAVKSCRRNRFEGDRPGDRSSDCKGRKGESRRVKKKGANGHSIASGWPKNHVDNDSTWFGDAHRSSNRSPRGIWRIRLKKVAQEGASVQPPTPRPGGAGCFVEHPSP